MGDAEDAALQNSYSSGIWGFQQLMLANVTASPPSELLVMRVSLAPWFARQWTIHLNAMRFSTGTLLSSVQPPDNQVSTSTPWKVRVRWGASEATENAIADYMPRGCSFTVHASDLSVFLLPNNVGAAPPLLSGFITPSGQTSAIIGDATFTTSQAPIIAPLSSRIYAVPDRACAYRWATRLPLATVGSLTFNQMDGNQAICQYDLTAPAALNAGPEVLLSNKSGYVPLHPSAQFIQANNADNTNAVSLGLQFLLDLG